MVACTKRESGPDSWYDAVIQAPRFEWLSSDPFALFENGFVAAEVDIGGRDVVCGFVEPILAGEVFKEPPPPLIWSVWALFTRWGPSFGWCYLADHMD